MSSPSKHFDSKALPRSVFIFGCGYIGSVLAEVLISRGVRVGALTRNSETAERLRRMDVLEVIEGRLHESHWQRAVTGVYEGVVNCVSSAGGGIEGYRLHILKGRGVSLSGSRRLRQNLSTFIQVALQSILKQMGSWSTRRQA